MQYINLRRIYAHYNLQHDFTSVFRKVELALFSFLSVAFLFLSSVIPDFRKNVSIFFVDMSLPVVEIIYSPFTLYGKLTSNLKELVIAKKQNEVLREDNDKLRSFYAKALAIYQENKELRSALNFVSTHSSDYKIGRIIGRANEIFDRSLFVDVGSEDGVKEGSVVIGSVGVIGRIVEVTAKKSRVMMITDTNSRIPTITLKSRIKGVLAGNNSDQMEILYLPKNHSIEVGDWVFTSGDGDTLPLGLLMGVVKKVGKGYAAVEPAENSNNANIVTIINY